MSKDREIEFSAFLIRKFLLDIMWYYNKRTFWNFIHI